MALNPKEFEELVTVLLGEREAAARIRLDEPANDPARVPRCTGEDLVRQLLKRLTPDPGFVDDIEATVCDPLRARDLALGSPIDTSIFVAVGRGDAVLAAVLDRVDLSSNDTHRGSPIIPWRMISTFIPAFRYPRDIISSRSAGFLRRRVGT